MLAGSIPLAASHRPIVSEAPVVLGLGGRGLRALDYWLHAAGQPQMADGDGDGDGKGLISMKLARVSCMSTMPRGGRKGRKGTKGTKNRELICMLGHPTGTAMAASLLFCCRCFWSTSSGIDKRDFLPSPFFLPPYLFHAFPPKTTDYRGGTIFKCLYVNHQSTGVLVPPPTLLHTFLPSHLPTCRPAGLHDASQLPTHYPPAHEGLPVG